MSPGRRKRWALRKRKTKRAQFCVVSGRKIKDERMRGRLRDSERHNARGVVEKRRRERP
jgi:hypothetical protein